MATAGPWTALESAGVPPPLLAALPALGYSTMTPVQAAAIPPLLARKDVCVQAETGSGKTLSFLLPAAVLALADGPPLPTGATLWVTTATVAQGAAVTAVAAAAWPLTRG